jgi:hypothetical protein
MFDPSLFTPGVDPIESSLKPAVMTQFHLSHCKACQLYGSLDPECYFYPMVKCIHNGWKPPRSDPSPTPLYSLANSPKVLLFLPQAQKEFDSMIANGAVRQLGEGPLERDSIVNPVGLVL